MSKDAELVAREIITNMQTSQLLDCLKHLNRTTTPECMQFEERVTHAWLCDELCSRYKFVEESMQLYAENRERFGGLTYAAAVIAATEVWLSR
jgi:hypothetical protein